MINCGILVTKLISENPQLSIANIYQLPAFSGILSAINIAYIATFGHSVDIHTDQYDGVSNALPGHSSVLASRDCSQALSASAIHRDLLKILSDKGHAFH